jgi:Phage P22-like portal protein
MAGDSLTAEEILKEAHQHWMMARDVNREDIAAAERDLRFLNNDQWKEKVKRDREEMGRPALVLNVLWPYVNQVSNDYAQADVALEIDPVGDGADEATSDVFEGLIRHIEYESDASDARNMRFFYAVACGRGYSRLVTTYESDESRNQVVRIERIQDPFSVVMDPYANKLDGSDAEWVLILDSMSKDAFKKRWPDSETAQENFFENNSTPPAPDWIGIGSEGANVQVAEYWKVYGFDATRVQMKDGSMKLEEEVREEDLEFIETGDDGEPVTKTTKSARRVV